MTIIPLGNWVLIEIEPTSESKVGDIIVPETVGFRPRSLSKSTFRTPARRKATYAKVLAVGPGELHYFRKQTNGERYPVNVKPGDRILFTEEKAAYDFTLYGKWRTLIACDDIDAIDEPN